MSSETNESEAQLSLFADLYYIPTTAGQHRQLCVTFTGFGEKKGRQCRVVLPNPQAALGHVDFISQKQREHGLQPDVRVEARYVNCGEWRPA